MRSVSSPRSRHLLVLANIPASSSYLVFFSADLSAWDTSQVTNMHGMLLGWSSPPIGVGPIGGVCAYMGGNDPTYCNGVAPTGRAMYCSNPTHCVFGGDYGDVDAPRQEPVGFACGGGDCGQWDTSKVTDMRSTLKTCPTFDTSQWNTAAVTRCGYFAWQECDRSMLPLFSGVWNTVRLRYRALRAPPVLSLSLFLRSELTPPRMSAAVSAATSIAPTTKSSWRRASSTSAFTA